MDLLSHLTYNFATRPSGHLTLVDIVTHAHLALVPRMCLGASILHLTPFVVVYTQFR